MTIILPESLRGAFGRDALYGVGIGDPALRHLRHDRTLLSLRRGTFVRAEEYYAADAAGRHALEVQSLRVAMPSRKLVATGLSAARIHGLSLLDRPPPLLHVSTPGLKPGGTARDGYVLRVASLPEEDVCERHGVLVTTPARTVADLLREFEFAAGVTVADSVLFLELTDKSEIWGFLDERDGRPGIETARKALEFATALAATALESASRAKLYLEGIPVPTLQMWLRHDIRVDGFWPIGIGVVGDSDGREKYVAEGPAQTREKVRWDLAREAWIRERHIYVRWGWAELENPAALAATLRAAFIEAQRLAA